MKKWILCLLAFVLLFSNANASQKLVVGVNPTYAPFEYMENETLQGISIDFLQAYAIQANMEIEFKKLSWEGLLPALQTGQVDMVISSLAITDKRKAVVDFSRPYAQSDIAILSSNEFESLQALQETKINIAVILSSSTQDKAQSLFPKATIAHYSNVEEAVQAVVNRSVDALLYDAYPVLDAQQQWQDSTHAFVLHEQVEQWGIAFPKGSAHIAPINAFIESFHKQGGFALLTEKYKEQGAYSLTEEELLQFFAVQ